MRREKPISEGWPATSDRWPVEESEEEKSKPAPSKAEDAAPGELRRMAVKLMSLISG